ncbi:archaeal DNA polymerase II [Paenibacillus popilliae ATCC 14706]|uniref:Archaeal DNA polymerase II n=1 Tax=Paenibacillus popilliae ATCC 14706 TaxID=1212764 RepID=M9LP91_PAEPP|nr:archaeal DNA polymerase II [Paenibacillus popilliae ATCC 14706]
MKDQDRCPECDTFWEQCPCCGLSFCPDCRMVESDAELKLKEDE